MQNLFYSCLKFFKFLYMYYMIFHFNKILASGAISPKFIGKYQLAFENRSKLEINFFDHINISFGNFETEPNETILENDGQSIIIQMNYDDDDKLPWISIDNKPFQYGFVYMYFYWLKKVPKAYSFKNVAFPGELHVVFYDMRYKDFAEALDFEDRVYILAFGVKLNSIISSHSHELQKKLKMLRTPQTEITFKNFPLGDWLNITMQDYCLYKGNLQLLSSQSDIIWFDMYEPIEMSPQVANEFQLLQSYDGNPLLNQFPAVPKTMLRNDIYCSRKPYDKLLENNAKRCDKFLALILIMQITLGVAGVWQ